MRMEFFRRGLCGIAVLGAAGCVSVLPEPESADALYRIEAATDRQNLLANLIIREPEAPQIVAGNSLVSEDASGAIRLVRSVEWAGRSTRLLQLALVDSFSVGGEGAAILPETGATAKYELSSRVQAFELRRGDAVCEVSVALLDTGTRVLLKQGEVRVSRQVSGDRATDRAGQMKSVAEQCVAEMSVFAALALNQLVNP